MYCVLDKCIVFYIHVLCFIYMYCVLHICIMFWIHVLSFRQTCCVLHLWATVLHSLDSYLQVFAIDLEIHELSISLLLMLSRYLKKTTAGGGGSNNGYSLLRMCKNFQFCYIKLWITEDKLCSHFAPPNK